MVINCNNILEAVTTLFVDNNKITVFSRGSSVYGTLTAESDNDIAVIVPDDTEFIDQPDAFANEKADTRIHQFTMDIDDDKPTDVQVIRESDFIEMVKEHTPFALEAIFLNDGKFYDAEDNQKSVIDYREHFTLDKWLLRESFDTIANNSFVKAKKKMTVKKDLDYRCSTKSLFHSIRLLMYACQIAEFGYIENYQCGQDLYQEIMDDFEENNFEWPQFKEKYKPVWNEWHSKLVKLCPKPRPKYKVGENVG